MNERRRRAAFAIALATAIALPLTAARRLDPLPDGLRAQYFANADWRGEPARSNPAGTPSTAAILADNGGAAQQQFSASWNGWLIAPSAGPYTFATESDDGSEVFVDGELVVDNRGEHGPALKSGPTVVLDRGIHSIFVRYMQLAGGMELRVLWQRGGRPFEPLPAWATRPGRITYQRFVLDQALDVAAQIAFWSWIVAVGWAAGYAASPAIPRWRAGIAAWRDRLREQGVWPAIGWIVALSAALNVTGLWWGLPHGPWVGDELIPNIVISAWPQRFMHGWHDRYPPLHFYLLTLSYLPVFAAEWLFALAGPTVGMLLMVAGRTVSVVMATVTVAVTFACGRRAFGPRAGLWAALMCALVAPFIYYAKAANVDVPYVMWFAISLLFYLRVLEGGGRLDYILWALAGALSVCTKDQAYGLFAGMPFVVAIARRRDPFLWRRFAAAAAAAAVTFAVVHNVFFNAAGFVAHVRMITGPGTRAYRAFEPTWSGRLALLDLTLRLIERNFGWPMFVMAIVGVVLALVSRHRRTMALWLLVPVASDYLTFVNVVFYNYDRFLLPVCVTLAIFGGHAFERLTTAFGAAPLLRRAIAVAIVAYTFLYTTTVDVLMLTDARYAAERWLMARVRDADLVATSSIATYMPRTTGFASADVYDRAALEALRPRFYVLNADYTLTEPPGTPLGQIIGMLRSGHGPYRLAFSLRSPIPWPWLPGGHPDLVGPRRDPEVVSFLRNINPQIEIYERVGQ